MLIPLPPVEDPAKYIARDRVLLYTRGMNLPAVDGMALALESVRRAKNPASPSSVMAELFSILHEQGQFPAIPAAADSRLESTPPINRVTVLPRDMEPLSFFAALSQKLRALFRKNTSGHQ